MLQERRVEVSEWPDVIRCGGSSKTSPVAEVPITNDSDRSSISGKFTPSVVLLESSITFIVACAFTQIVTNQNVMIRVRFEPRIPQATSSVPSSKLNDCQLHEIAK